MDTSGPSSSGFSNSSGRIFRLGSWTRRPLGTFSGSRKRAGERRQQTGTCGSSRLCSTSGSGRTWFQANPFRTVEGYPEQKYVRYVPPPEDIDAARMAATAEERDLFDALYFTAGRLSEILNLVWERDINFERRTGHAVDTEEKGEGKRNRPGPSGHDRLVVQVALAAMGETGQVQPMGVRQLRDRRSPTTGEVDS